MTTPQNSQYAESRDADFFRKVFESGFNSPKDGVCPQPFLSPEYVVWWEASHASQGSKIALSMDSAVRRGLDLVSPPLMQQDLEPPFLDVDVRLRLLQPHWLEVIHFKPVFATEEGSRFHFGKIRPGFFGFEMTAATNFFIHHLRPHRALFDELPVLLCGHRLWAGSVGYLMDFTDVGVRYPWGVKPNGVVKIRFELNRPTSPLNW